MPAKFDFAPELELSILRLMARDLPFLALTSELLKPEYFDSAAYQWYFVTLRNFYKDHRALADQASLKNELRKAVSEGIINEFDGQTYIDIYRALWDAYKPSLSYIQSELTKFACKQAMIQAIKESPDLLAGEKFDDLANKIVQANNLRKSQDNATHRYFLEFADRWKRSEDEEEGTVAIPTGIPHLDNLMKNGGLSPKELGVIMAPPGRGKSNFLVHAGKRAIFAGKKVLHVTLEMSYEKVSARYDSAFSGINANFLKASLDSLATVEQQEERSVFRKKNKPVREKLLQLQKLFGNALVIREYPTRTATVGMVEADIDSLRAEGFKPDILMLDYADIMKPSSKYGSRWEEQGAIYEEVRGLAVKHKIPVWTGCQANRASLSKQTVRMEDIADSFEKAKVADVILGLSQTDEEKQDGLMRIFMVKNRDAAGGQELVLKQDQPHMQFHVVSAEDFDPQAIKNQKDLIQSYRRSGVRIVGEGLFAGKKKYGSNDSY